MPTPIVEILMGVGILAEREKLLYPVCLGQTLTLARCLPPCSLPSITCSPRRAWWMVRLRLLCILKRMTLPVWLNLGAPATYTRPCLEDTTDVTVYPAEGGNRLVSAAGCSVGLAGFWHGVQLSLRRSTEFCFPCAHGLMKRAWRCSSVESMWLTYAKPCN